MGQTEQGTPPPGWYFDGTAMRWWDGYAWGPYAPPRPVDPVEQGKPLAAIAHAGFLACWFVVPLVILLTAGRDNEYVRHHATEALNFMICATILYVGSFAVFFGSVIVSGATDTPPVGFAFMPLLWVVQLGVMVFAIIGIVRAAQGAWWRYPISIRFVSGARRDV